PTETSSGKIFITICILPGAQSVNISPRRVRQKTAASSLLALPRRTTPRGLESYIPFGLTVRVSLEVVASSMMPHHCTRLILGSSPLAHRSRFVLRSRPEAQFRSVAKGQEFSSSVNARATRLSTGREPLLDFENLARVQSIEIALSLEGAGVRPDSP